MSGVGGSFFQHRRNQTRDCKNPQEHDREVGAAEELYEDELDGVQIDHILDGNGIAEEEDAAAVRRTADSIRHNRNDDVSNGKVKNESAPQYRLAYRQSNHGQALHSVSPERMTSMK